MPKFFALKRNWRPLNESEWKVKAEMNAYKLTVKHCMGGPREIDAGMRNYKRGQI